MIQKLKKGQGVVVSGEMLSVVGMIEFTDDGQIYWEYQVKDIQGNLKWLCVEQVNGEPIYSLFEDALFMGSSKNETLEYKGQIYTKNSTGKSRVKTYFGPVDADIYEACDYAEYISPVTDIILTVEEWVGEVVHSAGKRVPSSEVIIKELDPNLYMNQNTTVYETNHNEKQSLHKFVKWLIPVSIMAFLFYVIANVASWLTNDAMSDFIKGNSNFVYVSSETSKDPNVKGKTKIYRTNLTVDKAVKTIIDGISEDIKKVLDDKAIQATSTTSSNTKEEDGVGLLTKDEYAYVYTGKEGYTYVMVSDKNEVSNTSAYHSRYGTGHYYSLFSNRNSYSYSSSRYGSYWKSSKKSYSSSNSSSSSRSGRQGSVFSRSSSGGGTSYGK